MKYINPFKPLKIKKLHFGLDTDRDKVIDFKDCKPFNKRLQHVSDVTWERITRLPIYVSDEVYVGYDAPKSKRVLIDSTEWSKLGSKNARQNAPESSSIALSILKHYPSVLGDIERYGPEHVYLVLDEFIKIKKGRKGIVRGSKIKNDIIIFGNYQRGIDDVLYPKIERMAETFHHELKHVAQYDVYGEESMKDMKKEYSYDERPYEIEARKYAKSVMKKYREKDYPLDWSILDKY